MNTTVVYMAWICLCVTQERLPDKQSVWQKQKESLMQRIQ